jgi:hypothetical protein
MTECVISQGDLDFYEKHKDVIENFLNQPGYSEERKTSIRNIPPMFEFEKMNYQAHESPHFRRDSYWPNFVDK